MKKVLSLLTIVLLALPAFGQDEVVLTGGDIDAALGGNRGNRGGNRGNNNQPNIGDPLVMFEELRTLLKNNKVPLDKNQEKPLQTLLTNETQAMRTALEAQFSNRGGTQNGNRGGNNREVNAITVLGPAVTKYNGELLTEIKAALAPDQVAVITKAEKDKKACTTLLDLINFTELRTRLQNQSSNFNGGGRGGGGGLDLIGLDLGDLGLGGGGGGGNRGNNNQIQQILQNVPNRPSCTSKDSTTAQRTAVLGDVLTKEKKPLTADQSTKVSTLIETKLKAMTDDVKAQDREVEQVVNTLSNFGRNNNNNNQNQNQSQQTPQVNVQTLTNNIVNTIMQNLGVQNSNNNNNNNNGGGRGGRGGNNNQTQNNQTQNNQNFPNFPNNNQNNNNNGGRGNNNQNFNPQAEIQKKNEELLDKVAASLKPEQGSVVKKMKYDQIKAKGPVDKYRGILEEEGTPLTPEQITQIQQILNASNQAVRTYAQGLVTTEINALEPGALQAAAQQIIQQEQQQQQQQQQQQNQDPRNRGNNNNNVVNNVSRNGVAQQIVAKVINQVSVRHAQQEKVAADTILSRVLTPAQQASYKVSQIK